MTPCSSRYLDFIFAPFRAVDNKILGVKNIKGNIKVDINRVEGARASAARRSRSRRQRSKQKLQRSQGQPQQGQPQQPGQPQQGYPQQGSRNRERSNAARNAARHATGNARERPGCRRACRACRQAHRIRTRRSARRGSGSSRRSSARSASSSSTRRWDACPFCAQIAQQAAAAPAKLQALKTQAFVIDPSGGPGSMQLLGWLVPLRVRRRASCSRCAGDDDRHRPEVHDRPARQVHVEQARRDQGRERHVGPARRGLDQRHLRQQPARRSPRARRQRLHQVRQRDAASSRRYEDHDASHLLARSSLAASCSRARGVSTARADGQVEVYLQVKPPDPTDRRTRTTRRRSKRRSSAVRTVTARQVHARRRRRRQDTGRRSRRRKLREYTEGTETIAIALVINGQEIWIGNDDYEPEDEPAQYLGVLEEPRAARSTELQLGNAGPPGSKGVAHLVRRQAPRSRCRWAPLTNITGERARHQKDYTSKIGTDMVRASTSRSPSCRKVTTRAQGADRRRRRQRHQQRRREGAARASSRSRRAKRHDPDVRDHLQAASSRATATSITTMIPSAKTVELDRGHRDASSTRSSRAWPIATT